MSTVYLLHFERPIGNPTNPRAQAQHYLGFTGDLEKRLKEHRKGWSGAGLVRAFRQAGIKFRLARTWEGDGMLERKLKNRHNAPRLCPICRAQAEKKQNKRREK